ncbi:preprotein translocase subunit SecE [Neisseria perflava]|uniref:preprotein translocase subunit SecE n=1 Tax=Neisseria perflava TaxID=33053 RepID=UPI00209E441F|nr:preprotein translocase subunit SecE [Neisseria perflava]MCP1660038.1 preprotein translocase SecE subunit [Neisseria perflava]MCP1771944.1 preprotein translocase SecE subunit [Neisseria perflava]
MTEHTSEDTAKKQGQLVKSGGKPPAQKREGLFAYFRNSWVEFKKVVWPSHDEAVKMTIFVVIFVAVLSAFIYVVDTGISWLFFDILLKRG